MQHHLIAMSGIGHDKSGFMIESAAKSAGVDCELNDAQMKEALQGIDYIFPNEEEALLILKGALHSAYNFGDNKVKVLAVIAPKIVEEQLFPTDADSPKKVYGYDKTQITQRTDAWDMPQLYGSVDQLGVWPVEGNLLREKKGIYHITEVIEHSARSLFMAAR